VKGATITLGRVDVSGGAVYQQALAGGNGGAVDVASAGRVTIGAVYGGGGPGYATGSRGGNGGRIAVRGGTVATGRLDAYAGSIGDNGGGGSGGGTISVIALHGLTVGGHVTVDGSGGRVQNGQSTPGGNAGTIAVGGGDGLLRVSGLIAARGGDGSDRNDAPGGTGGRGGKVDAAGAELELVGIATTGGRGGGNGDRQGPGGAGGPIRFLSDDELSVTEASVLTTGGDGQPVGGDGAQTRQSSPTDLKVAAGRFSFTSRSPEATAYRVVRLAKGAKVAKVMRQTTRTSGTLPVATIPRCLAGTYTVVALLPALGWVSSPSNAVVWRRPGKGC